MLFYYIWALVVDTIVMISSIVIYVSCLYDVSNYYYY